MLDYHTFIVIASHSAARIKKERGDIMNMHDCQGLVAGVASLSFYTHKETSILLIVIYGYHSVDSSWSLAKVLW